MKHLLIVFLLCGLGVAAFARNVRVRSYTKKSGTHVTAHQRSSPNKTQTDNWSAQGNVNPNTGKVGHKRPKK